VKETKPVILGIDVEEWYQTMAFSSYENENGPALIPHYAINGVKWLLDILEKTQSTATFFINGELADEIPDIVSLIDKRGFEIASHGYCHLLKTEITPQQMQAEIEKSVKLLQKLTKKIPSGYRTPNWSINPEQNWFFEMLAEQGFHYDASIMPVWTPWFGTHCDFKREPFKEDDGIIRFYPTAVPFGPIRIPIGMGFLFRWLPYTLLKSLINFPRAPWPAQINIHAWECASTRPYYFPNLSSFILTGTALKTVRRKIIQLCSDFKVTGFRDWLTEVQKKAATADVLS